MAIARLYNSNTYDKHNTIRELWACLICQSLKSVCLWCGSTLAIPLYDSSKSSTYVQDIVKKFKG